MLGIFFSLGRAASYLPCPLYLPDNFFFVHFPLYLNLFYATYWKTLTYDATPPSISVFNKNQDFETNHCKNTIL